MTQVIRESLRVPMRDGVTLSVQIDRPETNEPVPVLLSYTPYRKGRPGGVAPYVTEGGYACAVFDVRGTGDSGGANDSIYSDAERQDGYDMIEWLAAQPWCNGNVGMYGISYGAVVALQMAKAAPPHLKAIIARSGSDDPYTEWTNPGGQPRSYLYQCYSTIMTAFNFSPPDPEVVGAEWADIWRQRLEGNVPWGLPFIEHLFDGPFWRDRSLRDHYDDVRCAVYVVDGWTDWYASPLLRIYNRLNGPKRALMGPWSHQFPDCAVPGPRIDWTREMRRWFDYWLKGEDTGIMDEPPVILFVRDYQPPAPMILQAAGSFRAEEAWPLPRQVETPLYLGADGTLSEAPGVGTDTLVADPCVGTATGMHGGGPFNDNWMNPLDQREDTRGSLVYTGAPLAEALEVTGDPRLRLRFTPTTETVLFAVKLCDVAPDGTAVLITKGFLNASHRHGHTRPEPLTPGETYEVEVELLACAYRLAPGHRLRVMLAGADFLNVWPLPMAWQCAVLHASCLRLPVISPQQPALPAPELGTSPIPLPTLAEMDAPEVTLTRDLVSGRQTVAYRTSYGRGKDHTARYTVDPADPAHVVLNADARFRYAYLGRDIEVVAQCDTTSDAHAFHHSVEVNITINGHPHFHKSWATSVKRELM